MRSIALLILAVLCRAGSLTGTLRDPDGLPVRNVPVQLTHAGGTERFNVTSSPAGTYTFSKLPAGTYDLFIPEIGFSYKKLDRKGIVIGANGSERLDLHLEFANGLGTIGDDDSTFLRMHRPLPPSGPAPRMPDGKPDLSGVWNGQNEANPEEAVVLPWAAEIAKNRRQRDNPSTQCLPSDILLNSPNPFEIVQTPKQVLIIGEYASALREVFIDGRPHPANLNPSWMGHSIGRWDGDTLVVDTVGFNDRSWLDLYPHTEKLHVVTRYRRTDRGHLDVRITVEDPDTFSKPWNLHHVWDLVPGEELQEYICENNKDPQHMAGK